MGHCSVPWGYMGTIPHFPRPHTLSPVSLLFSPSRTPSPVSCLFCPHTPTVEPVSAFFPLRHPQPPWPSWHGAAVTSSSWDKAVRQDRVCHPPSGVLRLTEFPDHARTVAGAEVAHGQGVPRWGWGRQQPRHAEVLPCPCPRCSFAYTSPHCLQPYKPAAGLCFVKKLHFNVCLSVNVHPCGAHNPAALWDGPRPWDRPSPSAWLYFSQPLIDVNLILNFPPPLNLLSFFSTQLTECFSFSFLLSSGPLFVLPSLALPKLCLSCSYWSLKQDSGNSPS